MSALFMNSLTEFFAVVGSVTAMILVIAFIIRCFKLAFTRDIRHLLHYIYVVLRTVAVIGIAAALLFEMMHGINYNRTSIRKSMNT